MVDVRLFGLLLLMKINEIDYVDYEWYGANVRYSDVKIIDHRNNHFVYDENNPVRNKRNLHIGMKKSSNKLRFAKES